MKTSILFILIFLDGVLWGQSNSQHEPQILIKVDSFFALHNDNPYNPHLFSFHEYEQINIEEFHKKYELEDTESYSLFMAFSSKSLDTICSITSNNNSLVIENQKVNGNFSLPLDMQENESHIFMYCGGSGKNLKKDVESKFLIGKTPNSESSENEYINITELEVFNKVVSPSIQKKEQSRLSIKYGIPLPKDSIYFDSDQEEIFSPSTKKEYINEVTILGNDKNLHNSQAINVRSRIIEVGLNELLPVQNGVVQQPKRYLCFSSNGEDLDFKEDLLTKIWHISGDKQRFIEDELVIKINFPEEFKLERDYDYFLVGSETDDFNLANTFFLNTLSWFGQGFVTHDASQLLESNIQFFTILKVKKENLISQNLSLTGPSIALVNSESPFTIKSDFNQIEGNLFVYSNTGYLLSNTKIKTTSTKYTRSISITQPGSYFVVFKTDDIQLVKRLIIQ